MLPSLPCFQVGYLPSPFCSQGQVSPLTALLLGHVSSPHRSVPRSSMLPSPLCYQVRYAPPHRSTHRSGLCSIPLPNLTVLLQGRAYWSLGNAHTALGNHTQALEFARWHLQVSREIGDEAGKLAAAANLRDLQLASGATGDHGKSPLTSKLTLTLFDML